MVGGLGPRDGCTRSVGMPAAESSAEPEPATGGGELPPALPPPYLISTPCEVEAQIERFRDMKLGWLATYPGWAATLEAKCRWLREVETGAAALYDSTVPIGDFFGATARAEVHVLLVVRDEGFARFNTPALAGEEAPAGCTVVAKAVCVRGDRIDVVVPQLLANASLACDATVRQLPFDGVRFVESLPTHVGECVHYGRRSPGAPLHCAVALLVSAPGVGAAQATMAKCLAIADELPMAVRKGSGANGGLGTIWVRDRDELQRAERHLRDGYGELDEVRRRVAAGGGEAAHIKMRMIRAELRYFDIISGPHQWRRRLSQLLGLTLELDRDMAFIEGAAAKDAEVLRVAMGDFAGAWRSVLSQNSEHELGICPPGEEKDIASFSALISFLEVIKEKVEAVSLVDDKGQVVALEFACLPKVKRGVKRPAAQMPQDFYQADARYMPDLDLPGAPNSFSDRFSALGAANGGGQVNESASTNPIAASVRASLGKSGRPQGRVPKDSYGFPMDFDENAGVWRSPYNPNETRVPATKGSTPSKAASSSSAKKPRQEREVGGTMKRPKGRAPHDSKGEKMHWVETEALWRSRSNPNETTLPKRKSTD